MRKYQTLPITDSRPIARDAHRGGFTLVEMLVSVALVLLMMSMFAAVFQLAAESTSTQRGISENDQRARSVTTTLRNDLDKRTFRNVIPFLANEDANNSPIRFDDRSGFIEIITNDPANGVDDTLLLTVSADSIQTDDDQTPYLGRSEQLFDGNPANNILVDNPNQPEMDDGIIVGNRTSQSRAAQIAYVVRNGNLYRRVMLLREPRERAGRELNPQPTFQDGTDPFATAAYFTVDHPPSGLGTNAFWRDFDFSAIRIGGLAQFIGIESLNNAPGSTFFTVAKPHFRFGHSATAAQGLPAGPPGWTGGFPRQFTTANTAMSPEFLGFFLQEETSFPSVVSGMPTGGFSYPHGNAQFFGTTTPIPAVGSAGLPGPASAAENGDPMDIRTNLTLNARKVVSEFTDTTGAGGPRRSEDLLLSNVHEFRIEIWDDRLSQWVVPGHNRTSGGVNGDYHVSRRYNSAYGPFGPAGVPSGVAAATTWDFTNHAFDTWHPNALSGDNTGTPGQHPGMPPFRAMEFYPPVRPDGGVVSTTETTNNGLGGSLPEQAYWFGSDFTGGGATRTYNEGDTVFPFTEDSNGNGLFDSTEDTDGNGMLTQSQNIPVPFGYSFYFRCVRSGLAGDISTPPNWQLRPGALITENDSAGPTGTYAIWEAVPNLRPLRSVRITVRFIDQSSQQMRQSTIIHSLVD